MYVLDVIPTVKIPKNISQVLSYFSSDSVKLGSLVSVPLGRAKVNALVVNSYDVDEEKISIRKSGFQMRSVERIISENPILSKEQIKLLKWFLKFYVSPVGLSVKTFLPSYLVKKKTNIKIEKINPPTPRTVLGVENILVVGRNREGFYKKEIKKVLQTKRQVLFLVPDTYLLEYYEGKFKEFGPEVLTSGLSPKKYFDAWLRVKSGDSKFILATRVGVFSNFFDLGLVILDKEESPSYKSWDMMPYYHTNDIVEKLSELSGAKLILGSSTPRIKTYFKAETKQIELVNLSDTEDIKKPLLIDMRNEIHGGNYSILSYQVQQKLEDILKNNKQAIFFISRRGAETFVFCRDCGYVEKCPKCEASLIHHKERGSVLLCHSCGYSQEIELKCPECKSHRIKYFGAGTQKAKEEIEKLFEDAKVGVLDSDATLTQKEQKEVFDKFKSEKINVLIGTQLLFKKYDLQKVDLAVVLSMDNLLYLPDFRSGERIFKIASSVSAFCKKTANFLLQTHTPENSIFEFVKKLDYKNFYKNEISQREAFSYPPFTNIVKLIYKNRDRRLAETEAVRLVGKLEKENLNNLTVLGPAPAHMPRIKNNYIWHIILKIQHTKEAEKERSNLLKNLPESWIIDVNPESLL